MYSTPLFTRIIRFLPAGTGLCLGLISQAQEWTVIDTFDDGVPQRTWIVAGQPQVDTSYGYLSIRPTPNVNATSSIRVALPRPIRSGTFTIAFDFYAPDGPYQNQVGWGIGSDSQALLSGWRIVGERNRFQLVSRQRDPNDETKFLSQPQNATKATSVDEEWNIDIFAPTEQGVFYNVWLVYDLSASPKTVTSYTKKASLAMTQENLVQTDFTFNDTVSDDWSMITYFAIGQGLQDNPPPGLDRLPSDALGGIFDNIYVSTGENLTLTPTSTAPQWELVEKFDGGAPQASWTLDASAEVSFENDAGLFTVTGPNAGASVPLPIPVARGSLTLTMDIMFPSGGLNNALMAVVGENELGLSNTARFGNNDRFITFGGSSPQSLTKWASWTTDLLNGTEQDTWYHVWYVYDHSALTVDVYSTPIPESGSATIPFEPVASFPLETDYAEFSHLIVGGWLAANAGLVIDNIYQSFGTNITLSPTAGELGTESSGLLVEGEWNSTAIGWVYGYAEDWGYSPFMGFIQMGDMPWIYQVPFGHMNLVQATEGDAGTIYWFYSPTMGWIYVSDTNGGFFHEDSSGWVYDNFLNPNG